MPDDVNFQATAEWAESSIRILLRKNSGRAGTEIASVRVPGSVEPFRFYALNDLAPLDEAYKLVVSDQQKLVAHAIIAELIRRGYPAHLTPAGAEGHSQWTRMRLASIKVLVEYCGHDASFGDSCNFEVVFDLFVSLGSAWPTPAAALSDPGI